MTDLKHLNKIIELILSKENLSSEEVRAIPRPFVDEQFLFALFDLLKGIITQFSNHLFST